jgi:hypothetical protein
MANFNQQSIDIVALRQAVLATLANPMAADSWDECTNAEIAADMVCFYPNVYLFLQAPDGEAALEALVLGILEEPR